MKTIKNRMNYLDETTPEYRNECKCCEEPSQTLQGEVHSIKELIQRHANGQEVPERQVQYFDVSNINMIDEFHAPGHLDFTDLERLQKKNAEMQKAIKKQMEEKKKEKESWSRDQPRGKDGKFKDDGENPNNKPDEGDE